MVPLKEQIIKKQQEKYQIKANKYLNAPQKTNNLLKKALQKAKNQQHTLGDAWDNLKLFIELVKDYSKGNYRKVSTGTILTILGAIIYFVSPVDLVPDFIVGLGLFDDAAVIGFTLKKISAELDHYKVWKQTHI